MSNDMNDPYRKLSEDDTVLSAWHSVFKTTQLSHAYDNAKADGYREGWNEAVEECAKRSEQTLFSCEGTTGITHFGKVIADRILALRKPEGK